MMKLSRKQLEAFVNTVDALVPECRLMITPDGWNTIAVDAANVAMVSASMPATLFEAFDGETKTEIGMDVPKWKNMLTVMRDPDAIITISRPDGEGSGKLNVSDGKYTYTITLLDPNTVRKRPAPPTLTLPAAIAVDAKELQEAIKAMGVISDKVRFTASKAGGLVLDAEGETDRLDKGMELDIAQVAKLPEQPVSSLFSLDYLTDISRAMKGTGRPVLHLGTDYPIRFDFEIEGIEASYLVAPRIDQGDAA